MVQGIILSNEAEALASQPHLKVIWRATASNFDARPVMRARH
jgi:hypothetical protein